MLTSPYAKIGPFRRAATLNSIQENKPLYIIQEQFEPSPHPYARPMSTDAFKYQLSPFDKLQPTQAEREAKRKELKTNRMNHRKTHAPHQLQDKILDAQQLRALRDSGKMSQEIFGQQILKLIPRKLT